jgi:hypothetical protein
MGKITFAKAMIALCLLGSAALAHQDWKLYQALQELREDVRPYGGIELTVRETQELGKKFAELSEALEDDALSGHTDMTSYIRSIADMKKVNIGDVTVGTPSPQDRGSKIEDLVYKVEPVGKRYYNKTEIGNFLYTLEDSSPRTRVTWLQMEQINEDGKPTMKAEEFPIQSDRRFSFKASVSTRQRKDG